MNGGEGGEAIGMIARTGKGTKGRGGVQALLVTEAV